jgi:autotransporter translocation and assembly factor TamB
VNGVLTGYALSDLEINLLRERNVIRIDSLNGVVNGARVEGHGAYTLEAPSVLRLDVDVGGLDLSKGFVPGKKLPETNFNGAVTLDYRVQDKALSFTLDVGKGDYLGFPFAEASARGSYADDTLKMDEVLISHPTHTIHARGTFVGVDEVSFIFDVECQASDTIFKYFNVEEYRADATLNGRWEGTLTNWDLRMNGSCGNLSYHGAFVPAGAVKLAVQKDSDFTVLFELDGPGCTIGPVKFTGLSLSTDFRGKVGTIKRLNLTREDFKAAITADVETKGKESTVRFKKCSLEALGETWIGGGAFTVFIGDTVVRFDDIQFHSKSGAAYVDGAVGLSSKTVRGRFAFERLGLELFNRAGLLKTPLAGQARGTILCSGPYADPDLDLDLEVEGGRIDTLAIDTLLVRANYAKGRSTIDSLVISSPSGSVSLGGEISGFPIRAAVGDAGAALKKASVAIESSCRNLDLVPLLSLAGIKMLSGGRLSGSISVNDSLVHPLVSLKGRINRLSVSSFTIPSVDCDVTVDRGQLSAEGTLNVSPEQGGSFHGSMPLEPARFLYSLDRSRPVAFELDLPEGDLAALSSVTDLVMDAAGRYAGRLGVTGTIASPHLEGNLELKGASFRLAGMEEKYNQVNAAVVIQDTLITISKLNGREGKDGTIGCAGTISLRGWKPAEYRVSCDANDFVLASLPGILAIVSGNVGVGTRVEDGRALPVITGSCRIKESEVYYDLASFSEAPEAGTLELPSYIAAIDLAIPGNTWIRTPDARIELQGNVTLYHDGKGTYLRGELNLVRGWYNVYGNRFSITSGKLQFVYAGSFRPVVDIEAETHDAEGRIIYLTLQWHQDDLQPRLTLRHQDPGYSETDIWKMLGGGVVGAQGAGTSWDARGTAQSLAANYLERVLNSQMEGVTIELETGHGTSDLAGTGDYRDTKIGIGKYLSQGLYVKYKQGLSISSARQIEVEYRISNLFLIRSEVIRNFEKAIQGNSPRTSDEINVDLKLRWEF